MPSPTDHMLAEGWPIHLPQRRAQEGLQSGVEGQAGPEHQVGGFGPVHPMGLILLNKCSKVHNTCYFHKGTHPCNYRPDQETHLSAPQKRPNLKSLGDLAASVDPALPPRLPFQPAKPQISHLDAKGLNRDRKFFPPLCQRVKGTGERVLRGNTPGGGGAHWADPGRCPLAELGGKGSGARVPAQTYAADATRGTFLSSLLTPRGGQAPAPREGLRAGEGRAHGLQAGLLTSSTCPVMYFSQPSQRIPNLV